MIHYTSITLIYILVSSIILLSTFLLQTAMDSATFQRSLAIINWSVSRGNQLDHSKTSSHVSVLQVVSRKLMFVYIVCGVRMHV